MKQVEVVLVSGQFEQPDGTCKNQYAVMFKDGTYKHHQDTGRNVTFKGWQNAIKNTHKHYVVVEEFTPEVVHPYKEELSKAFDLDEVDLPPVNPNVDMETGEVKEDPQVINNNPLKQEKMDKQVEQPQAEAKTKPSMLKKVRWYTAVGASLGVKTVTGPTHFVLQTGADLLQLSANGVANTEGFLIKQLKVSSQTIAEIRGYREQRTKLYESVALLPITTPINLVKQGVESVKNIKVMRKTMEVEPVPTS